MTNQSYNAHKKIDTSLKLAFGRDCDIPFFLRINKRKAKDKKIALDNWENDGGQISPKPPVPK
jgi:hypothetical protein